MQLALIIAFDPEPLVESLFPPLGLAYIASYLERYLGFSETKIYWEIDSLIVARPDIVGISSVSQNFERAIAMAKEVKSHLGVPVLIGGMHISALPHTLPSCFDIGVLYEGEETMVELMRIFLERGGFPREDLAQIDGIVFHTPDGVQVTGTREWITPLDKIPFPKRELLKIAPGDRTYMFSSRGCPYRCAFCASSRYWQKLRYFSAEYVVKEIEELVERYRVPDIHFFDDLFVADKGRAKRISEMVIERGLQKKVGFSGAVRANLIDEETCAMLRAMNFHSINFGAETGSERVLHSLKGPNVTVADNQRVLDLAEKFGLKVGCSFILGAPGETVEDAQKTYEFISKNRRKISQIDVYPLVPFPGTPIWHYAEEKGLVSENMEWLRLQIDPERFDESKYPFLSEAMTREDFLHHFRALQDLGKLLEKDRRLVQLQREFEERTAWALELDRELAQVRNSRLVQLQREFEERTAWALELDRELAQVRNSRYFKVFGPHKVKRFREALWRIWRRFTSNP